MFGKKLKSFTVHVKPEDDIEETLESSELVQEGFRWFAFLFPVLWALYNKMWVIAILLFSLIIGINILHEMGVFSENIQIFIKLAIQLLIGFCGDDLIREKFKRKGYDMRDVVFGYSEEAAQLRFLERHA